MVNIIKTHKDGNHGFYLKLHTHSHTLRHSPAWLLDKRMRQWGQSVIHSHEGFTLQPQQDVLQQDEQQKVRPCLETKNCLICESRLKMISIYTIVNKQQTKSIIYVKYYITIMYKLKCYELHILYSRCIIHICIFYSIAY